MANAVILIYASIGLVGIIVGVRAWRFLSRSAADSPKLPLNRLRLTALVAGAVLAIASFVFGPIFSYPVSTGEGPERIVGWPFVVAYLDSQGRDHAGLLAGAGALGNFVFWLLAPQFPLASYVRRLLSRAA